MPRQGQYPELESLQARMNDLPHLKRTIVMLYAIRGGFDHSVEVTAAELAETVGIPRPHFSQVRQQLVADGWLEYTHKEGQVKFYRLGETATGRSIVVPLRSTG